MKITNQLKSFHRALCHYALITDHFVFLLLWVHMKQWHVAMVINGVWSVVNVAKESKIYGRTNVLKDSK